MNIKYLAAGAVALAIAAVSGTAQAQPQQAVTSRAVNLRAGPAPDYPLVAVLPAGFGLSVQGCLPDYSWCDVIAGASRGWMWAGNINYYYQNSYVPVLNYGAILGIGALAFILNDYWGDHYRDRRFYGDRRRWEGRHFVQPNPRYVPPRDRGYEPRSRGYVAPPNEARRRDYITRPGEVRPRAEQPPPSAPSTPRAARRQEELNQGGSTSVDPRLRPNY